MNRSQAIVLAIILLVAVVLGFLAWYPQPTEQIIGGDRDIHGCLIAAGYSWNETESECVREWEAADARYQITNFQTCADADYPVMESYPRQCRTPGGRHFVEELENPLPQQPSSPTAHECTLEEQQAEMCTLEYAPVCALIDNGVRCITAPCASTNAVTSSNGCSACSAQAIRYYPGACEDQQFVVCEETSAGFDPEEYARQSGGICVDICPRNYDSFGTQIGIEVCIQHYGIEGIAQWETCEKSSGSCDCVKAYETTASEPIEDAQYRCVPEKYAQRLLFRGGVDRLDEQGGQSVMIA